MTGTATVLRKGDRGPEVVDLQFLLQDRGGISHEQIGIKDGIFGPKTEAATRQFQKNQGLLQDGIVGERTWGKLADAREWPTHFPGKFLRKGDTGAEELQQGLKSKGIYQGAIDGIFGPKTHEAVLRLQRDFVARASNNIEGVVGPYTFVGAIGD